MSASQVASAPAGSCLGLVKPYCPYCCRHVIALQQTDHAKQRPDRVVRPAPDHPGTDNDKSYDQQGEDHPNIPQTERTVRSASARDATDSASGSTPGVAASTRPLGFTALPFAGSALGVSMRVPGVPAV